MSKKEHKCPKCGYPVQEPNENAVKRGFAPVCRICASKEKSLKNVLVVERKES